MEFRQLRSLVTLVESGYSVSRSAEHLHLVQSAVSQHITRLEHELELQLFVRQGKRILALTETGEQIYRYANETLSAAQNIFNVSDEHLHQQRGVLRIGATHTQARYILPTIIKAFNKDYPEVEIQIHQSTPERLAEMALHDDVDIAICTEVLAGHEGLVSHPCYQWNRSLITLPDHPLTRLKSVSLKRLCDYPIITYVHGFTGRGTFDQVLSKAGLSPHIVLSAADTDVIKTYVSEGMGVGVIASMAYNKKIDPGFHCIDISRLFPWESTKIAYKKGRYIRAYQMHFIELFQKTLMEIAAALHIKLSSV
ncbi:MAG: LysR substrate-binding domain-containing protein [Gammaproteobacteria bacterium]|nr:LysR substrate-binding domain-containing protein [Gammaproteobacteria bacterium]